VNEIDPEQLGLPHRPRVSGLGGDHGVYGYERYLRRRTVYPRWDEKTVRGA
jgi:hypothetical protein